MYDLQFADRSVTLGDVLRSERVKHEFCKDVGRMEHGPCEEAEAQTIWFSVNGEPGICYWITETVTVDSQLAPDFTKFMGRGDEVIAVLTDQFGEMLNEHHPDFDDQVPEDY
jgi:hypothetical protein